MISLHTASGAGLSQHAALLAMPDGPCPASCLLPAPRRSKTLIGDYLGERDDFNLRVMHSYVDAMDFESLEFDMAIRCPAVPCCDVLVLHLHNVLPARGPKHCLLQGLTRRACSAGGMCITGRKVAACLLAAASP